MKTFLFMMQLFTPQGPLPPQAEPMPSLEACIAQTTKMQKQFGAINEDFKFAAGCVQVSSKADPA